MKDFLFKKNLWMLDSITSISFSFVFGFLILKDSVTGKPRWAGILFGTLTYFLTFILAIILQKKISWLPSWAWLGVFGALFRIVSSIIIYSPRSWNYYQKFSASHVEAIQEFTLDILKGTVFNWLGWAIPCLIAIFAVRFFAYICVLFLNLDIREKTYSKKQ